ncbi:MAG: hypothetical protein JWO59_3294 [Chloroflexi bacterium]|nr:hypothetical protein [Chloroflexota bacterium]
MSEELFEAVQRRLDSAASHLTRTKLRRPQPLAAGVLRCHVCDGPMTFVRREAANPVSDSYVYLRSAKGKAACGGGIRATVAYAALLDQIKRLGFRAWDLQRMGLPATAKEVDGRAELQRGLDTEKARLKRHIRYFTQLADDPTRAEIGAHRELGAEINERILFLENALKATASGPNMLDLKRLHAEYTTSYLTAVIDMLHTEGDSEPLRGFILDMLATTEYGQATLRALVGDLIDHAVLVERHPASRPTWARARVTWTPAIQALIDANQVTLTPDVEGPTGHAVN